jgi:hypothetical protein
MKPITILFLILLIMTEGILAEALIGFDFPFQNDANKNIETLKLVPQLCPNSLTSDLTICLRFKLKFWNTKCIFSSSSISLIMLDYKRGFVR